MATIELNQDNFQQTIENNATVIIDFWAPWCAPCRSFAPTYEAASEKNADIVFAKVNTEEQQQLAGSFGIRSIPTLMVFREKIILYSEAGALPAAHLDHLIAQVKDLDMNEVRRQIAEEQSKAN
jgi:thioredoxin